MVRLLNSTYSAATNLVQNHVEITVYYDVFINVFFLNVTFYIYPMSHISHSLSLIMSSLNYLHHMPSYNKCLHASASYMSYAPSCLTYLTYPFYLHALRALSTRLSILFVCLKIFSRWICSPLKSFHFPRFIKGTTNLAVFVWVEKENF